jgi:hypothetical protein
MDTGFGQAARNRRHYYKPKHRRKDNISTDFKVIGWEGYRVNSCGSGWGLSESFCKVGNEHLFP